MGLALVRMRGNGEGGWAKGRKEKKRIEKG